VYVREIAGLAALSAAKFQADDHRRASCSAVEAGKCIYFLSLYANCACIHTENMPISMKMCQFLCLKLCLFLCLHMLIACAHALKFVSENALHERGLLHKEYKN
jgi:hypothetical protein